MPDPMLNPHSKTWQQPHNGRLAGDVVEIAEKSVVVRDERGVEWQVESDEKTTEFLYANPAILAYAQERLLTLFIIQKITGLKTHKTEDPIKQLIKMNKGERIFTSEGELKLMSIFNHLVKIQSVWKKEIDPMRFKTDL
jgi:hypothetical protein